MILFSYEVDVLEIALREAQDLVDKIVIVEASQSHRGVWTMNRKFTIISHMNTSTEYIVQCQFQSSEKHLL